MERSTLERSIGKAMIRAKRLTKYFGDVCAISNLDFEIRKGEVVGLLGLNGAGKTTALRILGCLLLPTSGQVTVDGIDVVEDPHEVRKRIGFVPETPPLYPEMTVRQYLEFAGRIRGMSTAKLKKRLVEVEKALDLSTVFDRLNGVLSHGFRRRVAIAQAIIHDPAVLILDDPILGLDPVQIVEMRGLIRSLRGKHTLVLSSHILTEIEQTCDRILVIHEARVVAEGTEEELSSRFGTGHSLKVEIGLRGDHPYRGDMAATVKSATELIRAVPGVSTCTVVQAPNEIRLDVEASRDVRAAVGKAVVDAGMELLGLGRGEVELEGIFVQATQDAERAPVPPRSAAPPAKTSEATP